MPPGESGSAVHVGGDIISLVPELHKDQFMKVYDRFFAPHPKTAVEKEVAEKTREKVEHVARVAGWISTGVEGAFLVKTCVSGWRYLKNNSPKHREQTSINTALLASGAVLVGVGRATTEGAGDRSRSHTKTVAAKKNQQTVGPTLTPDHPTPVAHAPDPVPPIKKTRLGTYDLMQQLLQRDAERTGIRIGEQDASQPVSASSVDAIQRRVEEEKKHPQRRWSGKSRTYTPYQGVITSIHDLNLPDGAREEPEAVEELPKVLPEIRPEIPSAPPNIESLMKAHKKQKQKAIDEEKHEKKHEKHVRGSKRAHRNSVDDGTDGW